MIARASSRRSWPRSIGFAAGGYILSFLIVFDLTEPALLYDKERDASGREIAAGPRPREWFLYPSYHDLFYTGNEWPFWIYRPLCVLWCPVTGRSYDNSL